VKGDPSLVNGLFRAITLGNLDVDGLPLAPPAD
jgi:hypothetical protein